jgi:hypothetical protein
MPASIDRWPAVLLLFKSSLCIGLALTVLLYGWSEYLEPSASKARTDPPPVVRTTEAFRPTPAPAVADLDPMPPAEAPAAQVKNEVAVPATIAKAPRPKVRKQKAYVARPATAPHDTFAFRSQPFFFGWR